MDWVFITFCTVTVVYALSIIKEHFSDARIQQSLLDILDEERIALLDKTEEHNQEGSDVVEEIKKGKETVDAMKTVIDGQNIQIKKFKEAQ